MELQLTGTDLKDFQRMVHFTARAKGFWANLKYLLFPVGIVLAISELIEAMEAHRRGHGDEKIAEELADVIIRVLDMAEGYKLPVIEQMVKKAEFNKTRPMMNGGKLY